MSNFTSVGLHLVNVERSHRMSSRLREFNNDLQGRNNGSKTAEGPCLFSIVVKTAKPKAALGGEGLFRLTGYSTGRNSRQGLKAESVEERSSLAHSQLRFSYCPGPAARDGA